jgi:hypothetical protein
LHNLMSLDRDRFVHLTLYDTMAPSVSARRFVSAVGRLDGLVGAPLKRFAHAVETWAFKGWEGIHKAGIHRSEEDEALWCYPLMTPAVWMGFPFVRELSGLAYVDRMPEPLRERLSRYIGGLMSSHMTLQQPGRTLLLKNVFLAGRIETVTRNYPDARFIYLTRDPIETVPSTISMFTAPWRWHSPDMPRDSEEYRAWGDLAMDYYLTYESFVAALPADRRHEVRYTDLVSNPRDTVLGIYRHFGWEAAPAFVEALEQSTRRAASYSSTHRYTLADYGMTADQVYDRLRGVFERHGFTPPEVRTPTDFAPTPGTRVEAHLERMQ